MIDTAEEVEMVAGMNGQVIEAVVTVSARDVLRPPLRPRLRQHIEAPKVALRQGFNVV